MALPQCLLIAHRGESFDAPENTSAAFDLAWQRQCEAIELDVHVTADGQVVVCHDADTRRIAGVNCVIRESTLALLQTLDIGSWKSPQFASERLTTLDAALTRVPAGRQAWVEIKPGVESVGPVMAVIDRFPDTDITVIAFDRDVVCAVKQRGGRRVLWLVSPKRDPQSGHWQPTPRQMIDRAMGISDGLGINADSPIDREFVDAAHAAGLSLCVWTVDDPVAARRLTEAGVDAVTSNRAAWMREQFGWSSP
jgi:glycerophosphoryl diester phosphodiesterase